MKSTKLTNIEISEILEENKLGTPPTEIAKRFKIGSRRLGKILKENGLKKQYSRKVFSKEGVDLKSGEILKLVEEGSSIKKISEETNLGRGAISNFLKSKGIASRARPLEDEKIINEIIFDYRDSGMSQEEIRKKYSISLTGFKKKMEEKGVKIRRAKNYSLDESYFDNIDTGEKAYFFGLLMADGCVTKTRSRYDFAGRVSISLQERDSYLLDAFKLSIGYSGPIYFKGLAPPRQNQRTLSIASKRLCDGLKGVGMEIGKTFNCKFPSSINREYMGDFVRGMFDGDGCATYSYSEGYMKKSWSIICTEDFADGLINVLKMETDSIIQKVKQEKDNIVLYDVRIASRSGIEDIYNFLYKNANTLLSRKKEKMEEILKIPLKAKLTLNT